MTKFIREKGLLAPILIYTTNWGIRFTRYVESYKMVGSLVSYKEFDDYVDALGDRRRDDIQWAKYGGF